MRETATIAIERAHQQTDPRMDGSSPSDGRPRGRHAAPLPSGGSALRRRRWFVVVAVAAAFTGLVAPPPGPKPVERVADAALPQPLTSGRAISFLSSGAPTGSITLASAPAHVAPAQPVGAGLITGLAANGIPNVALNAYRVAAARMANAAPSCGIDWSLLAGIGRVESNHGRFGGAVLNSDGSSTPRIVGPSLNGVQFAFIRDTDRGMWDGDSVQDRAVGPMQFIPATWRAYAVSTDGTRAPDPFNVNDAALAAAHYLCVAGGDLRSTGGQRRAVMAYNHSDSYVAEVLALAHAYAAGIPVADLPLVGNTTGPVPAPSGFYGRTFAGAPASPGPAIGASDTTPGSGPTNGQAAQPAAAPAPSGGGTGAPGTNAAPAGGSPSGTGSTTSGPGSTAGGTTSGSGSGTGTGTSAGSAPAPAPAPARAPLPPPPTVSSPITTDPITPNPITTDPLAPISPTPIPGVTCGAPLLPACP